MRRGRLVRDAPLSVSRRRSPDVALRSGRVVAGARARVTTAGDAGDVRLAAARVSVAHCARPTQPSHGEGADLVGACGARAAALLTARTDGQFADDAVCRLDGHAPRRCAVRAPVARRRSSLTAFARARRVCVCAAARRVGRRTCFALCGGGGGVTCGFRCVRCACATASARWSTARRVVARFATTLRCGGGATRPSQSADAMAALAQPTIVLRPNPPAAPTTTSPPPAAAAATGKSRARFPTSMPRQRPEWLANDAASACMACNRAFGVVWRRHHCRSCGLLYCADCTDKVYLPLLGYTSRQLTCVRCIDAFYSGAVAATVAGKEQKRK